MLKFTVAVAMSWALAALAGSVLAEEQHIFSGPQPGESLPPLNVVLAYGEERGAVANLIELADERSTLLIFVQGANRPAAQLTRLLMNYAEMRAADDLFAALVWLDADRSGAEQYLQQSVSWWGVGPPVGISLDGAEGPGSYGLNRKVNVTVLVARESRVTANFALVQPSATDAPRILAEVCKLIGGEIPTEAERYFLGVPTRKPQNAPWQAAPQDVELRRLVCRLLAAEDDAAASRAIQALEEYVGQDAERQVHLARVAEILRRGRVAVEATAAANYLRRW